MRLPDDYIEDCKRRARKYQGQWTGTAGSLAADSRRLQIEREELLATIDELERKNAELRAAVEGRLAKASPMAASLAGCRPAQEAAIACLAPVELPPDVPDDYRRSTAGSAFAVAVPQQPAEFKITPVGASLDPEQLDAIWAAARAKAEASVRGDAPPEPLEVEEFRAGEPDPYSDWTAGRQPAVRIIGLAGPAGCGKNLVASMIPDAVVMQFADPLYAALAVMTGIPEPLLRHRPVKEQPVYWLGKSPRQMLQTLGTDWGRTLVAEDVWLRVADRRCRQWAKAGATTIVIADVRFENEAEWVRSRGGQVWFVDRKPAAECAPHASEAGLPECSIDYWIDNTGTPEQTREAVALALKGK